LRSKKNDLDNPDAITITTLELGGPLFCCHEEVLSMLLFQTPRGG
jgi:hypothetical protein